MADPFWNPRLHPESAGISLRAYFAGYSDGYHGYAFGNGQHGDFSNYRPGFADGRGDAAEARAAA